MQIREILGEFTMSIGGILLISSFLCVGSVWTMTEFRPTEALKKQIIWPVCRQSLYTTLINRRNEDAWTPTERSREATLCDNRTQLNISISPCNDSTWRPTRWCKKATGAHAKAKIKEERTNPFMMWMQKEDISSGDWSNALLKSIWPWFNFHVRRKDDLQL